MLGLSDIYRDLAIKKAILADAKEIYMLDYRLAPQNVYPAALDDALVAYNEILKSGVKSKNIIIIGDSAGGNLALALGLKIKEMKLAKPLAYVLISPWTTLETYMSSRRTKSELDVVLGSSNAFMNKEVANPSYAGNLNLSDPRLSPLNADLSGLSPMLIQVGADELFVDEGIELAKRAANMGVDVKLSIYANMPHVFAMLLPQLDESVES